MGLEWIGRPSYINGVASLVNNPANNFALQAYFSYDGGSGGIDSDITEFPQSEAAFVVDFGGSGNPSPVTTTSTPSSSTTTSPPATTTTTSIPSSSSPAPHVMVVMMENQGSSQVIGNPAMPYTNSLASTYGSATQSFALAHPSLPNYLALVSGSAQGVTTDQDPSSGTFPDTETLAGQLAAAGISEAAYAEDLPADPTNDSGEYFVHHNPWEYFPNAPISVENSTSLVGALNSRNAPDFVWYTPNALDDGDGESTEASSIAGEESFLSSFIPTVQATSWYQAGGQIIIEWDEALASDTTGINGGAGGHVPTIVVSDALAASPQQDSTLVDTVGILRSIQDTYDLPYLGGNAADGNIDALLDASVTPRDDHDDDHDAPPASSPHHHGSTTGDHHDHETAAADHHHHGAATADDHDHETAAADHHHHGAATADDHDHETATADDHDHETSAADDHDHGSPAPTTDHDNVNDDTDVADHHHTDPADTRADGHHGLGVPGAGLVRSRPDGRCLPRPR